MPVKKKRVVESPSVVPVPLLVNLKAAAQLLGCTLWHVREMIWAGFPHVKMGRRFLVSPDDLRDHVEKLKRAA